MFHSKVRGLIHLHSSVLWVSISSFSPFPCFSQIAFPFPDLSPHSCTICEGREPTSVTHPYPMKLPHNHFPTFQRRKFGCPAALSHFADANPCISTINYKTCMIKCASTSSVRILVLNASPCLWWGMESESVAFHIGAEFFLPLAETTLAFERVESICSAL